MSLPEQLRKQVEEAQTILEKHYGTDATDAPNKGDGEPETVATQEAAATTAEVVETTHSARQDVTPAEDENSQTYAQRWRSLQGINNSLTQQNRQLEGRIGQLEQLIGSMSQAQPVQASADENRYLTDKDTEDFGADMVDFAKRAVAEATSPLMTHIQNLEARLAQVQGVVPEVQKLAQGHALTQEERFFSALSTVMPDWKGINNDQRFHNWLLQADPMTGITRQTYLEDAQRSQDVNRVASIFNSWKELSGTSVPAQAKPNTARSELELQVAPGRTHAAVVTPNASAEKRYTPQDINAFYSDVRKGVYKGREAERDALERDIFVAQREGRIARNAA